MSRFESDRCQACGGWPRESRLTLARARTGDLLFCGYQCWQHWEAERKAYES